MFNPVCLHLNSSGPIIHGKNYFYVKVFKDMIELSSFLGVSFWRTGHSLQCIDCIFDLEVEMRDFLVVAFELHPVDSQLVALARERGSLAGRSEFEVPLTKQSQCYQKLWLVQFVQIFAA